MAVPTQCVRTVFLATVTTFYATVGRLVLSVYVSPTFEKNFFPSRGSLL